MAKTLYFDEPDDEGVIVARTPEKRVAGIIRPNTSGQGPDGWFVEVYVRVPGQERLWRRPIRHVTGTHVAPWKHLKAAKHSLLAAHTEFWGEEEPML